VDPVAVLSGTALFYGVEPRELEQLARAASARTFRAGSAIFHEGDSATALFVVVRGQVKIARVGRGGAEAVFAVLLPGDTFGELTLFDEDPVRSMDAQAMELTECLSLGRRDLLVFLEGHPATMRHLVRLLGAVVRRGDDTFSEAAFLDIPGRVSRKLLDLSLIHI